MGFSPKAISRKDTRCAVKFSVLERGPESPGGGTPNGEVEVWA